MKIPFSPPDITELEIEEVVKTLSQDGLQLVQERKN